MRANSNARQNFLANSGGVVRAAGEVGSVTSLHGSQGPEARANFGVDESHRAPDGKQFYSSWLYLIQAPPFCLPPTLSGNSP